MRAAEVCSKAAELVGGDREAQHGDKLENFQNIAVLWNAWGEVRTGAAYGFTPVDVGVMMTLMKIARTQTGAFNVDDFIDACGYLGCAAECSKSHT